MKREKRIVRTAILALMLFSASAGYAQLVKPVKSTSIVTIEGQSYYVYTVNAGDTFYSLSRLYDVSKEQIIGSNPHLAEGLQADMVIKIPVVLEPKLSSRKMSRLYDEHIVNQGETAYAISQRYGITVTTLMEDNPGLDPTIISIGQRLNIRKKSIGGANAEEIRQDWQEYTEAVSSVSDGFVYHLVMPGESVFSISRMYEVTQHDVMKNNDLPDGLLKAGTMIRIPEKRAEPPSEWSRESILDLVKSNEADPIERKDLKVKSFRRGAMLKVALLLPLRSNGTPNPNFLDFYQGALLALEELKSQGISINLNLFNTEKSVAEVERIVASGEFSATDLVIGPIYEEELQPVLAFAEREGIPVISPLAEVKNMEIPLLYQMQPAATNKYDKIKELLSQGKNVVVISTNRNDAEFENEIKPHLPSGARRFHYTNRNETPVSAISDLIRRDVENIFVILAENENTIEEIMARISSVQNNLTARNIQTGNIQIVGSFRWARFTQIDKNLFFKLGVHYATSYHADRGNPAVVAFDKRYAERFSALPSLHAPYAYRGYDAMKLFAGTAGAGTDRFEEDINANRFPLLQTPYRFELSASGSNRVNTQWALVCFRPDYTIEVR